MSHQSRLCRSKRIGGVAESYNASVLRLCREQLLRNGVSCARRQCRPEHIRAVVLFLLKTCTEGWHSNGKELFSNILLKLPLSENKKKTGDECLQTILYLIFTWVFDLCSLPEDFFRPLSSHWPFFRVRAKKMMTANDTLIPKTLPYLSHKSSGGAKHGLVLIKVWQGNLGCYTSKHCLDQSLAMIKSISYAYHH